MNGKTQYESGDMVVICLILPLAVLLLPFTENISNPRFQQLYLEGNNTL